MLELLYIIWFLEAQYSALQIHRARDKNVGGAEYKQGMGDARVLKTGGNRDQEW